VFNVYLGTKHDATGLTKMPAVTVNGLSPIMAEAHKATRGDDRRTEDQGARHPDRSHGRRRSPRIPRWRHWRARSRRSLETILA
jgi:hypothetical protein